MYNKTKYLIILLFIMTTINAQSQDSLIHNLIEQIRLKFAHDKRTAIFRVDVKYENDIFYLSGEVDNLETKNHLLESLSENNIKFNDMIKSLPDEQLKGKNYGVVTVSVGNLRTKPDHPAELASQALLGTPVKVLKYDDGFYLVQTPDNYIAWIDDEGITLMDKESFQKYTSSKKVIYIKEFGFALQNSELNSAHVADLVRGNILQLEGENSNFVKVKFPDGRIAYVEKSDVVDFNVWIDSRDATKENILSEAFNMLGIPYLWGGTSYKGIDCSGFTKTVYFMNGIILSRDASQQVNLGEEIDTKDNFNNLQPGDLLFFGRKADDKNKEKITHVGIYIGNLEYIHESGKVKVNSFDENSPVFSRHRLKQFVRAKRILNSISKNGVELLKDNKFYRGEF